MAVSLSRPIMKLFQPRVISAYQEIQPNTLEAWLINEDSSERELADIELGRMPWEERRFRLVVIYEQEKKIKKGRRSASLLALSMPMHVSIALYFITDMFFKNKLPSDLLLVCTVVCAFLLWRAENQFKDSLLQQTVKVHLKELEAVREPAPTAAYSTSVSLDVETSAKLSARR